jgi:hypothetical protein
VSAELGSDWALKLTVAEPPSVIAPWPGQIILMSSCCIPSSALIHAAESEWPMTLNEPLSLKAQLVEAEVPEPA